MKNYIIRLKNNPISEKYSTECVEQAKKFNIEVEYFDAINGMDYEKHLTKLKIYPKYNFKKGKPGVFGCFLSHYYLWQHCVKINEPLLILEHDGYFIRPLPDNILDKFTEVLKLDNLNPYSKNYNLALDTNSVLPESFEKYFNESAKVSNKINTGNYIKGAYSYIIKPTAATKLLENIATNGFVPADQQIGDLLVDIRVVVPTVARLHPEYFRNVKGLSTTMHTELLTAVLYT